MQPSRGREEGEFNQTVRLNVIGGKERGFK